MEAHSNTQTLSVSNSAVKTNLTKAYDFESMFKSTLHQIPLKLVHTSQAAWISWIQAYVHI
jgi:hypothetical protein